MERSNQGQPGRIRSVRGFLLLVALAALITLIISGRAFGAAVGGSCQSSTSGRTGLLFCRMTRPGRFTVSGKASSVDNHLTLRLVCGSAKPPAAKFVVGHRFTRTVGAASRNPKLRALYLVMRAHSACTMHVTLMLPPKILPYSLSFHGHWQSR